MRNRCCILRMVFVLAVLLLTTACLPIAGTTSPTQELSIVEVMVDVGYSDGNAVYAERVLNSVGITSIEIVSMSGEAENGLNAMVCYPNGLDKEGSRVTVTTENGIVFYVGFRGEDLYHVSRGGVLKQFSDIPIPETDVSSDAEIRLMMMAEDVAKQIANYPATVDFKTLCWGFWRNDRVYAVQGTFTCTNAFGVKEEHVLKLICETSEDNSSISTKEVYLDGNLIKSAG